MIRHGKCGCNWQTQLQRPSARRWASRHPDGVSRIRATLPTSPDVTKVELSGAVPSRGGRGPQLPASAEAGAALLHRAVPAAEQRDCRHENPPPSPRPAMRSGFAGLRFLSDGIVLAVRWYLRFALSYRDVEDLLADRGIQVDHVTSTGGCCGSRRCCRGRPPLPSSCWRSLVRG
jgi:hypothetical protein